MNEKAESVYLLMILKFVMLCICRCRTLTTCGTLRLPLLCGRLSLRLGMCSLKLCPSTLSNAEPTCILLLSRSSWHLERVEWCLSPIGKSRSGV